MMKCFKVLFTFTMILPLLCLAGQEPLRIRDEKKKDTDPYGNLTGNPSFYSPTSANYLVSLEGAFTYWRVRVDGTGYFGTGLRIQPNSENSQGKLYEVNPVWEPGFRVGLGIIFPTRGWDVSSRYTYLGFDHSDSGSDLSQGGRANQSITTGNGASFRDLAPTSARASEDLHLNEVGLELGRKFFNSEHLALRFFTGLQGIWLSSTYKVTYHFIPPTPATNLELDNNDVTGPVRYKLEGNSWAVGPIIGFETNWYLVKQFSLFARFNYMLTYVNEDTHYKVDVEDQGSPTTNIINVKNNDTYFLHNFSQMQLGFVFDAWLSNHSYLLTLKLLYELNAWNSIRPSGGTGQLGGFGVYAQGLTAGASLSF